MIGKHITLLILLPLLIVVGCSGDENKAEKVPATLLKVQEVPPPAPAVSTAGEMRFQPADPTVSDVLTAVVQGDLSGQFRWSVNGESIKGANRETLELEDYSKGDEISCDFVVGERQIGNSIMIGNSLPQVVATSFVDPNICRGVDIEIVADAVDADGDLVDFKCRWFVNGNELSDQSDSMLPGDLFHKGDRIAVWIVPSDAEGDGEIFYGSEFVVPNAPPHFVSSPPASFEAQEYRYAVVASDPDGDNLRYSLESGPAGMEIDASTGVLRWLVDPEAGDAQQVRIVVTDQDGMNAVQEYTLNLSF